MSRLNGKFKAAVNDIGIMYLFIPAHAVKEKNTFSGISAHYYLVRTENSVKRGPSSPKVVTREGGMSF